MITNLRLNYLLIKALLESGNSSCSPTLPLRGLFSFLIDNFSCFFAEPELSFWLTAKALVWKQSVGRFTYLMSLCPSISTSYASSHLRVLQHDFHFHIFCLDIPVLTSYTLKNSSQCIQAHLRNARGDF